MRSLRFKIGLSYFVLVAITVAIGVFAAVQFTTLSRSLGRILRENYGSVLAAENMVKALERQEAAHFAMQTGDVAAGRASFMKSRDEFFSWYEEGMRGIALPEEPVLLDSIGAAYDDYLNASDSLARLLRVPSPEEARVYRETVVHPMAARVRHHNLELLEVNQNAMLATRERLESAGSAASKGVMGASVIAIVLSLLAVGRFARHILGPIGTMTDLVRRIGRGHLGDKIDVTSDDELAELEREFNKMTERLRAFEAMNVQQLLAEKKKTESLVQTIPSPVLVTDQHDRLLLLNRAAVDVLKVRSDEDWRDRKLSDVPAHEGLFDLKAVSSDRGASGVIALPSDGAIRYFRRRHVPVHNDAGGIDLHIYVLEDVTQFQELDNLKSEFLAAVSHELRTPLTSVGMAIDILLQDLMGPLTEEQRDLVQTMEEDSRRLKKLVDVLLSLARLESGSYHPGQETVHLKHVAHEALASLQLPFREKGVELSAELPDDLPPVLGDPDQLAWVISNLSGNALRHTAAGGLVKIEAEAEDGSIHLRVRDTGVGIPRYALERIFEKFVQLKSENDSTPGSIGLGLALARRVVEAHGGEIWAESELGRGSIFHVVLPGADVMQEESADGRR